jgi:hypothetical protein
MNLAFALKLLFPVFFEVVLVVALGVVFGFGFEVVAHPPSAWLLIFCCWEAIPSTAMDNLQVFSQTKFCLQEYGIHSPEH